MTGEQIIEALGLEPHPSEGGYFRRTYESELTVMNGTRLMMTSIYYMLTRDRPHGHMHRNKSDIMHYYHCGSSLRYLIISPDGDLQEVRLGQNLAAGERLQLLVRGGDWKISVLEEGDYALISEAVSPGFDFADNDLATPEIVDRLFPDLAQKLRPYLA